MKKIFGYSIIASLFIALFIVGCFFIGFLATMLVYIGTAILIAVLKYAEYLIEDETNR